MKDIEELKKIVILIDADNAQLTKLKLILEEISTHGHIIVKRAYGDWSQVALKNWKDTLNELAIQPIQQFAYTSGKNATDGAMIIDAMDLLYTNTFDAFVLVSSDSDFTMLASRLRRSQMYVFGVGENKTPKSFRNACDDFILTELLDNAASEIETAVSEPSKKNAVKTKAPSLSLDEVKVLLNTASDKYQDEDGWLNVSSAGTFIKRTKPDFNSKMYGFEKLPDLIASLSELYEMKKYKGSGTVNIVAYRKKHIK